MVVAIYYLHYERNESVDKYVSAVIVLAPLLEKVYQFLTKVALGVLRLEDQKQFWSNFWGHF